MPIKSPPHPGDFIRTEIIQPAGLTVTAAAVALRVSRLKMDTLMRMQSSYDIARTRSRERQIRVRRIPQLADIQPEGL